MSDNSQAVLRVEAMDTGTSAGGLDVWGSTLVVPLAATAISVVLLLVQVVFSKLVRKDPPGPQHEDTPNVVRGDIGFGKRMKIHVERLGGEWTVTLKTLRLGSCLFLLGLTVFFVLDDAFPDEEKWTYYGLCATYAYTSVLAALSLLLKPLNGVGQTATRHLIFVLFATFAVYVYRDVWPLATFTLHPADAPLGPLLWAQIAALALAGAVVPLVIPRAYVPYDPADPASRPSPEQTASVLSRMFVSFLDPLVWTAARGPQARLEQLPALLDRDSMKNLLKRCLKWLDPIESKSERHIFWALVGVFSTEHVELVLMLIVMDFAYLGSPLAVNKILSYLESSGEGATVRPWFWLSLLFVAPVGVSLTSVRYMSVVLRVVAQMEGVLTQVIFDHALRVRLKADTGSADKPGSVRDARLGASDAASSSRQSEAESTEEPEEGESTIAPSESTNVQAADKNADKTGPKTEGSNMIGMINNLVTTDLSMISYWNDMILLIFMSPFQIVICIWFLYDILGWSVFVGVAVMLAMMSIPGMIAKFYHDVQGTKMKKSDARVQLITEIMGGAIRMVKLFGWEGKMNESIDNKRREELAAIWKLKMFNTANRVINNSIAIGTMVATFTTYTLVLKRPLTASHVFPAIAVFAIIQDRFQGGSEQLTQILQAKVSLDRINKFLKETELVDAFSASESTDELDTGSLEDSSITIRSTMFTWDASDDGKPRAPGDDRRRFRLRIDDEVVFKTGKINLIVGPTGSGKTSMLMALLGEMHRIPLGLTARLHLPRRGGVAYHAQESWILNDTIRNNIVFGSAYDEDRYARVIKQCALERDLSLFEAGGETEVGERGITLSGGQKARITLARAVYSTAEILLLDDVLAALDVHTAQWIVDKCLRGDLVQGRTVVLVTHNVALASPIADFVVSLRDGKIFSQGSLASTLGKDTKLATDTQQEITRIREVEELDGVPLEDKARASKGKLILDEEISEGHVGWSAMKLLFGNTGSGFNAILFWLTFVGTAFASKFASALQTWTLGVWSQQYEVKDPQDVSAPYYLSLYIACVLVTLLTLILSWIVFIFGTLRASRVIHRLLIDRILNSTFRWLDSTPTSRIIARCTQDINAVDNSIVNYIHSLTDMTTTMLVRFGAVVIMSPIFGVPGVLLCIVGVWLGQLYMKTQLTVKRERSNARSPILGHISAAITGLVSIRAYGAQPAFRQKSFGRIDRYIRATITFNNLTRWISCRAETLAAAFSTSLAAYLVYGQKFDSSRIGFSLTMAVTFSHLILWIVRYFNEFEVEGNSLERIQQYLVIDQEPKPVPDGVPPASWPTSGDLSVQNLSARYSADGPKVLHNVSFVVNSGERVGIVGRTGSGKSSLTLALLRCILTEGKVHYSGLPTDTINLDALRAHITIIPQVPELLTGTLRENVDPFSQWDDATLNAGLAAAGLFSLEDSKGSESRLTLDSVISGGGANVSVGQRQIIALARAIVRQSKLLILDEATSAIDNETDLIIQRSLRQEVARNVTLLTVAHRLQTIMDYDKIIVLDAGRLVEFGKPSELLGNEQGYLRSLVDASSQREELYEIATRLPT